MPAQALQAYFALRSRGFSDDEICLMVFHSNQSSIDIDGDGSNDLPNAVIDSDLVSKESLHTAIDGLASNSTQYDEAIIYVIGHGNGAGESSAFSFESGNLVAASEFSRWLDKIKCKSLVILLDFCYSGDFAKSLEKSGRLIISAAEDSKESWFYWDWAKELNATEIAVFGNSGSAFFHPFWKRYGEGATIDDAFNYGKEKCFRWGFIDTKNVRAKNVTQTQNPQIYVGDRTFLENFVFLFPGGSSAFLIAVFLLSFSETAIIAAAVVSSRSTH
jgi:hypothetical protein